MTTPLVTGPEYAIDVERLSKQYSKVPAKESLMAGSLWQAATAPVRALFGGRRDLPAANGNGTFWAVRDVSFRLAPGESLGIIGPNGAGKSTLLRILARITRPTAGCVRLRGRVTPLLGVGTGFVGGLSGRANIYLNGSILGMSRQEIDDRFDEIVDFAGVREFIDMPVKLYSSGMYARLAFSVAAHIVTDILLVDEVLSVGDAAFSAKSLKKMSSLMTSGGTVVFVSHSMEAVMRFCQKTLWMDHGRVVMYGPTEEVAKSYLSSVSELRQEWRNPAAAVAAGPQRALQRLEVRSAEALSFELLDGEGRQKAIFTRDEDIVIRFRYRIFDTPLPVVPVIHVHCAPRHGLDVDVHVFTAWDHAAMIARPAGEYVSTVAIPRLLLNDGEYSFSAALVSPGGKILRHFKQERLVVCKLVDVPDPDKAIGGTTRGVVRPELRWRSVRADAGEEARSSEQVAAL